jgi:hypothetical protein
VDVVVCDGEELGAVRDRDDGPAFGQLLEECVDVLGGAAVEVGGGLVEQEERLG